MITKHLTSAIAAASIFALSGVSVTSGLGIQPMPIAQAASCDTTIRSTSFSGKAGPQGANLRSDRSSSASIVRVAPANTTLSFEAWGYGDVVNDIWTGQQDARWYKLRGENVWVASAVIWGNPPGNPSPLPSCGSNFYHNPEAFFNWANGQRSIARLDTNAYRGECVTLIARYLEEVFLTGSDQTRFLSLNNGYGTAQAVASQFSAYFQPLTTSGLPKRGAVISFPATRANPAGHVAIVLETKGQTVRVLESNANDQAPNTTVTSDRWLSIASSNGWTNPK